MTPPVERPWFSRLAVRFAFILSIALLPAAVISFLQTNALEREVRSRSEVALIGSTVQAAAEETALINRMQGLVAAVASAVPSVVNDPAACHQTLRNIAATEPRVQVAAYIPLSGIMTCSNLGAAHDFSTDEVFKTTIQARTPTFVVNRRSEISSTSILGLSYPVYDPAGEYIGYAGVSLPHATLRELAFSAFFELSGFDDPVLYWTFDINGQVLTSNHELQDVEPSLPSTRPLTSFADLSATVFRDVSMDGRMTTYSMSPIVPGELYLMSSFHPARSGFLEAYGLSAYLPTLLMWLAGLVASGIAADLLVTRHVRTLNRSILKFARGDRRLQTINLRNAPLELDELANAYMEMTDSVTHTEADLEDSVHQKEVLLREVHHRVKNNLQLIASIMNIQLRSARSGEARDLLKNLQERVMSLATVHRGLYQTSGLADVRARELIPDIVRQIMAIAAGPERPFETSTEIDDLRLIPDQAVPLSLLLAEALTNALKHSGANREHPGKLSVRLKRSGGSDAMLEVVNSHMNKSSPQPTTWGSGIGVKLIDAFVHQLGGKHDSATTDRDYTMRVTFSMAPLSAAENRRAADTSADIDWNVPDPVAL